jgi:hypothetical protein
MYVCVRTTVRAVISRHELPRVFDFGGHVSFQKVHKLDRLLPLREVEIHPVPKGHDVDAIRVCVVFEKELFEVEKGALVGHPLTHLHHRVPRAGGEVLLAVFALLIADGEFHQGGLLQHGAVHDFFLNGQFDVQTHGMRFGPDPNRIDQFDF